MNERRLRRGWILCAAVVVGAASLTAQQPARPSRPAGGGLALRFKQLDRNGDGKVSREEGGSLSFFDAADKNKDGFLTIEEVQAYFAGRRGVRPAAQPPKPSEALTPTLLTRGTATQRRHGRPRHARGTATQEAAAVPPETPALLTKSSEWGSRRTAG
jgi:hypothetical protein